MSRHLASPCLILRGFPRVSGDEPALAEASERVIPFSPRERG